MILNKGISIKNRDKKASSLSLRDSPINSISIQLEFLDGCDFNCIGCFIKRKNYYTESDLIFLNKFSEQLVHDYELNELILGPTDLFGCKNAEDILTNEKFISLFTKFNALTINSTLQSSPEHIKNILSLIDNIPVKYVEIFVVFDMELYNKDKENYIKVLEHNLELVKEFNIIFVFNMNDTIDMQYFIEISKYINTKYNSHLKMVPSFFRSNNKNKIIDNLELWNYNYNTNTNITFLNNIADLYFGGYTYHNYTFKDGKLFKNAHIYDFLFIEDNNFEVPLADNANDILNNEQKIIQLQYEYASNIECCDCPLLASCVSKSVLLVMETFKMNKCILPKNNILTCNNINITGGTTNDK